MNNTTECFDPSCPLCKVNNRGKQDTNSSTSLSCSVASFDLDDAVVASSNMLAKLDGTDEGLKIVRADVRDTLLMVYKLGLEHGAN